jgi:hypothetical protein
MLPGTPQIIPFLKNCHIFARLEDADIEFIADGLEVVRVPGAETIIEQGTEATDFYFLYSGRVKVSQQRGRDGEEKMVGFLNEGDYFGREVLQSYGTHRVSVQAVSDCILLRLNTEHFSRVIERCPLLIPRLRLILESFQFGLQTPLNWVNPEEYVYYIARKHIFIFVARVFPLVGATIIFSALLLSMAAATHLSLFLAILGIFLFIALVWGILIFIDWNNDYYVITNRRVAYQERVILFYDSRQESPLEQVQSSVTRSGWWGRRLGFGDVAIRTFTGEIVFRGVQDPLEVSDIIEEYRKRAQSMLRQAELRSMDETIARRIGVIPPLPPAPPKVAEEIRQPSRAQRFLNTVFRLRYQEGDKITYRTHWFILLTRIWFQSLSLLVVSIAGLYFLVRGAALRNFPVLGIFFALCILLLVLFGWWLYVYYDWHHDEYIVTNDQITDVNKKPLGKEERRTASMKNILSIEYRRLGIIGLLLNYGTVYIRIGTETFTFDDVFDPADVQRELFLRLAKMQQREKQAQAENERQRMTDWLAAYHRVTHL